MPGVPELEVGTDALFSLLSGRRASYALNRELLGCRLPSSDTGELAYSYSSSGSWTDGDVEILTSTTVGPYETVVLRAEDSTELVGWLTSQGFDVPSDIAPLLAPYAAAGHHFVALRLAKQHDTGDIRPLVLSWDGTKPSIPIQLTSVAATPDMPLRVYVLGDHRAVPESYLHVQLNEVAIDWWSGGQNLEQVIGRAVDEAGGHAFFTDFSGPLRRMRGRLYDSSWATIHVENARTVEEVFQELQWVPFDGALFGTLAAHFGLPADSVPELDVVDVWWCPSCYEEELADIVFDPEALAADLDEVYFEPRKRANEMLKAHSVLTRLTTVLSAEEMTVDPTFVFNESLPRVPETRSATEVMVCTRYEPDLRNSPRILELPDGRRVPVPSMRQLAVEARSEVDWFERQGWTAPAAAIVERTSASGPPEVLVDNRQLLAEQIPVELLPTTDPRACGCATTASSAWTWLLPLAAVLRRSRVAPLFYGISFGRKTSTSAQESGASAWRHGAGS